jgi:hypothetical protein
VSIAFLLGRGGTGGAGGLIFGTGRQPTVDPSGRNWAKLFKGAGPDYRGLYHGFAGNFLNVSAEFGRFLYICTRARQAKRIVEFGTSFGISTIYLAVALPISRWLCAMGAAVNSPEPN